MVLIFTKHGQEVKYEENPTIPARGDEVLDDLQTRSRGYLP